MKKYFIIFTSFLTVFILFSSCNFGPGYARLSGDIVTDQRDVPDFDRIDVSSGIELILSQGSSHKVVVRADKDLQDDIQTVVRGGVLKIYCERSFWRANRNITVTVTFENIDHLKASAGANVKADETLNFDHLTMGASSGSNINITLKAESIELSSSSGANTNVDGKTNDLDIQASSGCNIKLQDLEADDVSISSSSGSNIHVIARRSIEVHSSSGSNIYVTGNPERQHISTNSGADVHFQ